MENEGGFYFLNRAFLILPAWVFLRRDRRLTLLLAPALAYGILAITLDVPNVRYLLPAVPALTVGSVRILQEFAGRWLNRRGRVVAITVVTLFALLPTIGAMGTWVRSIPAPSFALGLSSRQAYLRVHPNVRYYTPVVEYMNRDLPREASILMLFEARGFPVARNVLQDNKISNWPILAEARERNGQGCLADAGFDFVLLGTAAVRYYENRGLDPRKLRLSEFESFRRECLADIWQAPGYVLFQVTGGGVP